MKTGDNENKCLTFLLEEDKIKRELAELYYLPYGKKFTKGKSASIKTGSLNRDVLDSLEDDSLIKIKNKWTPRKTRWRKEIRGRKKDDKAKLVCVNWGTILANWGKGIRRISDIRVQKRVKDFIIMNREFLFNINDFKILFYRNGEWYLPSVYGFINISLAYFCICDYLVSKMDDDSWNLRDRLHYRKPRIERLNESTTHREYSILELLLKQSDDDFIKNTVALLNKSCLDSEKFNFAPEEFDELHSEFISRHFYRFLKNEYDKKLERRNEELSEGDYIKDFFKTIAADMYEDDFPKDVRASLHLHPLLEKGLQLPIKTGYAKHKKGIMFPELFDYFKPIERIMKLFE